MKPVYFPFTGIYEPNMRVLTSFFKKITFDIPEVCGYPEGIDEYRVSGFADVRMVKTDMDNDIDMFCQEYVNIANMHGKGNLDYLKMSQDIIPFRNEFSKDAIRSDIKKVGKPEKKRDPLFDALAFLKISHENDQHNYEIDQKIRCLDKSNREMLESLTDKDSDTYLEPGIHTARTSAFKPGQVKSSQRLTAWSLMFHAEIAKKSDVKDKVFVTDSNDVFDLVLSEAVDYNMLIDCDGVNPDHELITSLAEAFKAGRMEKLAADLSSKSFKSSADCYQFQVAKVKPGDSARLPGGQRWTDIMVCLINPSY